MQITIKQLQKAINKRGSLTCFARSLDIHRNKKTNCTELSPQWCEV